MLGVSQRKSAEQRGWDANKSDDFKRGGGKCHSHERDSRLANERARHFPGGIRNDYKLRFDNGRQFDDGYQSSSDRLEPEVRNYVSLPRAFHGCE